MERPPVTGADESRLLREPQRGLRRPRHTQDLKRKKLEVPVETMLTGTPPKEAASKDSSSHPEPLNRFAELAEGLMEKR